MSRVLVLASKRETLYRMAIMPCTASFKAEDINIAPTDVESLGLSLTNLVPGILEHIGLSENKHAMK